MNKDTFKLKWFNRIPIITEIETDKEFPFPHLSPREGKNLLYLLNRCCQNKKIGD